MEKLVEAKDVATSHKITEEIELILKEKFSPIRVVIHVEPNNYKSSNISFAGSFNQSNTLVYPIR